MKPHEAKGPWPQQLSFAQLCESTGWPEPRYLKKPVGRTPAQVVPELAEFKRRAFLAGKAKSTVDAQAEHLRTLWRRAQIEQGNAVSVVGLFCNPALLAAVCCDDRPVRGLTGAKLSRRTLTARRIAVRSFIRHMEDCFEKSADLAISRFESALRVQYRAAGLSYLPRAGSPSRRDLFTPSEGDLKALNAYLSAGRFAYLPQRDIAFIRLLKATALRLSSAVGIHGDDFRRSLHGLLLFVREKCRNEVQEVLIDGETERALLAYAARFNGYEAGRGSSARVGFGVAGPFWRCPGGRTWSASAAKAAVRRASARACARPFGPHAIRRHEASNLVGEWPRDAVAAAVGWQSVQTLDEHYAPRPGTTIFPSDGTTLKRERGDEDGKGKPAAA